MPTFADVKQVLDTIIANWTAGHGGVPPELQKVHGPAFLWGTREELLAAVTVKGTPLIQPDIVGKPGLGETANLVRDLTTGLPGLPAMPHGGLDSKNGVYLTLASPEIRTIVAWIEAGCP